MKNIYKFVVVVCLSFSSIVGFSLYSTSNIATNNTNDLCSNLSGTWKGSADVRLLVFSCQYEATLNVAEGNPAMVNINAVKTGGVFFCPSNVQHDIMGSCDNGRVTLKDDKVDVTGELSDDGKSAELRGSIRVLARFSMDISVNKT